MGVSWAVTDHHMGERIGANEIVHYGSTIISFRASRISWGFAAAATSTAGLCGF